MDRRSWPWKKRSSEKAVTTTSPCPVTLSNCGTNQADKDGDKIVDYIQISMESYVHITEMEEEVKLLNEKLSAAQNEMTNKENLVKQHAKVAEEAVSGWEKAEAETIALKHQLESVTLMKLTAEDRVSHLDGALKECMKQIRNVKEESEQRLHDVVFAKTKQWEKVKAELEVKLAGFEEELLRASAENAAISRSLQERSTILMKVNNEKMQADTEIEVLKSNIHSCEQEMNSLKYELHVISKELEIRNEEKNMSMRSADVAKKQHLEDVKKISKLEAECQRLRGLVRKKLPGPAALAQMKLEVENLGRDHGESRLRRSPAKSPGSNHTSISAADSASESILTLQKENEFLIANFLAIEEETKMLKETLSNRTSELKASMEMCAKQASMLCNVEAQMLALKQQKCSSKPSVDVSFDTILSRTESNPPSSTSEDGVYEEGRSSLSWAASLVSDLSQFKKEKVTEEYKNTSNSNHLELMDDFLEMEKLAHLSTESHREIAVSDGISDNVSATLLGDSQKEDASKGQQLVSEKSKNIPCTNKNHFEGFVVKKLESLLNKLQSRIASAFKFQDQDADISKVFEDIRCILQDTQDELPQNSVSCVTEENISIEITSDKLLSHDDTEENLSVETSSDKILSRDEMDETTDDNNSCAEDKHIFGPKLKNAISRIENFALYLQKEATEPQDRSSVTQGLREKVKKLSCYVQGVLQNKKCPDDFLIVLSQILSEATKIGLRISFDVADQCENNILDCIDKVTLLEKRIAQDQPRNDSFCGAPISLSHPENEEPPSENFVQRNTIQKFSFKELEQLRSEKENVQMQLSTCAELLEETKLQLAETEQNMTELKSQLAVSKRANTLSQTQLKCMAESYNLLESHAQELETEVNMLRTEVQTMNNELQQERHTHEDDLSKLRDLQEQIKRNEKHSSGSDADIGTKTKQENEIAAAAEKLAECQETILILGRQLQSLRPPAEKLDSSPSNIKNISNRHFEDVPGPSGYNTHRVHKSTMSLCDAEIAAAFARTTNEGDSPLDIYEFQICTSDTEAGPPPRSTIHSKHQKRRSSRASSSTAYAGALSEKHGRGFSWFFSKGKCDH